MDRKQFVVVAGAAPAVLVVLLAWRFAPLLARGVALPKDGAAERLAFAAHWLLAPGLTLLAGVVAVGQQRFFTGAIDGSRAPESPGLEINLRYNQNTLEETVLAIIAWSGLALALPQRQLATIPVVAGLFVIGRLTFWIGYRLHPLGRAFGMVLTVLPTVIAYAWLVVPFAWT